MTTIFAADNATTAAADVQAYAKRCQCVNPNHNHSDLPHLAPVDAFNSYGDEQHAPSLYASIVADFDAAFAQPLAELARANAENAELRAQLATAHEALGAAKSMLNRVHARTGLLDVMRLIDTALR